MAFDSPMKPIKPFPGEQDGPGIYGHNPHIGPGEDGGFKTKFLESIDTPAEMPLDSPFNRGSGKLGDKLGSAPTGGDTPRGSCPVDSPMKPIKKL